MSLTADAWRLNVAPMMDWTDKHCRFFHRLIAPGARLYTEMITTGAILHGDLNRLLDFNAEEHPVALQIGGSEPADLAAAAKIGQQWGYDEINLNCGCPSERVQKGAFGACLMKEPLLVAQGIKAMQDAVSIPVTVKHRIGVDDHDDFSFVHDFVGAIYATGCRVFIVHARSAILKGLSPKENREVPPLRLQLVRQLKNDFPDAVIVANGGIQSADQAAMLCRPAIHSFTTPVAAADHADSNCDLPAVDGVMIGRAAYHDPWCLHDMEKLLQDGQVLMPKRREEILPALQRYFESQLAAGVAAKHMTRHWHGLFHGQPGARLWRREICEGKIGPLELYEKLMSDHQAVDAAA